MGLSISGFKPLLCLCFISILSFNITHFVYVDASSNYLVILVGDISGPQGLSDGIINLEDITRFIDLYHTGTYQSIIDFNSDNIIDPKDIALFVNAYNAFYKNLIDTGNTNNFGGSEPVTYKFTMLSPIGQGTVTPLPGQHIFSENNHADVTATGTKGWVFDHWIIDGGPRTSTNNPGYLLMNGERSIQAVFIYTGSSSGGQILATIDQTKVDATLTDFPVMLHLNQNQINALGVTDPKKLSITQGSNQLFVEIEKWTPSDAILWVKVSSISATMNTQLRITATAFQNTIYVGYIGEIPARNVWDSGFKAVYHFSGNALDSTQYSHSGQWIGTPTYTTGRIGDAALFTGGNYISIPDSDDFSLITTGHLIVSSWFSPSALVMPTERDDGQIRFLSKSNINQNEWCLNYYNNGSDRDQGIAFYFFNLSGGLGTGNAVSSYGDPDNNIGIGAWEHLMGRGDEYSAIINGSTQSHYVSIYKNGEFRHGCTLDATNDITPLNGAAPVTIGHSIAYDSYLVGRLDEVRIDSTPRSDAWIKADYFSQMGTLVSLS